MYIKRFSIAAFLLIGLIGSYFYVNFPNEHLAIDILGVHSSTLPIAFWIVLPMLILYLATIAHMLFASIIGSFNLRKYRIDSETFEDSIKDALLGRIERHNKYKTDRYSLFGKVVDRSRLQLIKDIPATGNEKLDETISLVSKINAGEHVDLKKFYLSKANPLVQKNDINAYNAGDIAEEKILNNVDDFSEELVSLAFTNYAKTAPLTQIEKYKALLTKSVLFKIVARVNAEENTLDVSTEALISMFNAVSLTEEDFINLSATLSSDMLPDDRIKLFKQLADENETAVAAYLYTLFDLEMIAPAEEILDNSQDDEYVYFKAYKALKDCHKNFDIELFIPHKIFK
jgi:hypothetical protein